MLVCDTLAVCCTLTIFALLKMNLLLPWHLYVLNALNGLMNTVQQPASDVSMTLIIPKEYYQKTSGMRSFSQSLITILNPIFSTGSGAAMVIFILGIAGTVICLIFGRILKKYKYDE